MIYYTYPLSHFDTSLHLVGKAYLVMVHDLFDIGLNSVSKCFPENDLFFSQQGHWPVDFFFVSSLSAFGIRVLLASQKEIAKVLLLLLLNSLRGAACTSSLDVW